MAAYQLPHWVWPTALMGVCGLAIWRGRDEERLATGAILADWALTVFVYDAARRDTHWSLLLVDSAQFGVFLWIALRSRRYWPLPLTAFGLLELLTHVAHAVDTTVTGWSYITAEIIWSYLLLATIGYAAWTAPRYAGNAGAGVVTAPGAIRR